MKVVRIVARAWGAFALSLVAIVLLGRFVPEEWWDAIVVIAGTLVWAVVGVGLFYAMGGDQ